MKGGKNTHETADFTNHLEEFEKMVAIDLFNVYECMNCDDSIEDISSGTMTIQL
jgi:hypothetical protein